MDPDTATADFYAVQHQIIGLRTNRTGICLQQSYIFIQRRGKRMVDGHMSFFLAVVLQQGEMSYPTKRKLFFIDKIHHFSQMQAESPQGFIDYGRLIGNKKQEITIFDLHGFFQRFNLLFGKKLDDRRLPAIRRDFNPGQALGPIHFHHIQQVIDFLPGKG